MKGEVIHASPEKARSAAPVYVYLFLCESFDNDWIP